MAEKGSADLAALRSWGQTLKGTVVLPADADYDAARRIWNLEIDRRPRAVVYCADESDVRRAVEFASTRGLLVAVRSGGHSQAGYSTCDDGLLIDISRMNQVDVDQRARVARVGAGTSVGALLDAIGRAGMATPTGGCPDVGIGGLTLGGGESFLMARLGAVCDNVLSAQVVTSAGRIVTASAVEHHDLYWAIRGGGGNFGIATTFDFSLHPLERVLSGRFMFPVSRTREVVRRYRDLMPRASDELQTSGGIVASDHEPALFIAVCHCGDTDTANRIIDQWRSSLRPDTDDVKWMPYSAEFVLPPIASRGSGVFLPELSDALIDILAEYFGAAPPSCTVAWNDYHGAVTRVPVDAMAFPLRQPGYDLFVHAGWKADELRARASAWLDGLCGAVEPFARGAYVNNLGNEPRERVPDAYGANYERLARVKAKYDPGHMFRLNPNIPPRTP